MPANLLFELGVEEFPASYIPPALGAMAARLTEELASARLVHAPIRTLATPRRLTLFCAGIPERQEDIVEEVLGPPASAAFDRDGKPTKVGEGFARKMKVPVGSLQVKKTPKGDYCGAQVARTGARTMDLLPAMLEAAVRAVSSPKTMRWGPPGVSFARPIRRILALYGTEVVPFAFGGVRAGNTVAGHPFLSPGPVRIPAADLDAYVAALRARRVIVDVSERRALIRRKIEDLLRPHGGPFREEALLEEVVFLVEYPNAVACVFDESYLALPAEVLEAAMKEHQRYFPVRGADGKLRARFVSVTDRGDEHATLIREGNERVLRARLSDAKFFWDSDRKKTLAALSPRLAEIVYLKNLGTMAEKTARLVRLTGVLHGLLAPANEAMRLPGVLGNARRAAELCKNDLLTDMVGEFPELQGVMGAHYAIAEGEPREVADAVREHYLPRATDDALPKTPSGILLSLAEKLDNLAASFALDLRPTGSQDPYALRRQTIGLLKILAEHRLSLSMEAAFRAAVAGLPAPYDASAAAVPALLAFARDRLYQICIDEGTPHDLLRGAMAAGFDDVTDLKDRLRVLQALRKDRIWQGLVTIVERTHNIHKNTALEGEVQERLLTESAERRLWAVYRDNAEAIRALTDRRRYQEAAVAFHRVFAEPVHAFFAQVFVHVDDPQLRTNRMLLMKAVNRLFSEKIADLSEIGRA